MNCATKTEIFSLPPVIDACSRILVLGSMPGTRSLEVGQYYAYPRNIFWRIIETTFGISASLPYTKRLPRLTKVGLALWDVAAHCQRNGSLDGNIKNAEPNDFDALFEAFPKIKVVLFNGGKSAQLWQRMVTTRHTRMSLRTLPSTSPANTSMSFGAKQDIWAKALRGDAGAQEAAE
jgi:TDG/mug DNA glycosylase family protein